MDRKTFSHRFGRALAELLRESDKSVDFTVKMIRRRRVVEEHVEPTRIAVSLLAAVNDPQTWASRSCQRAFDKAYPLQRERHRRFPRVAAALGLPE